MNGTGPLQRLRQIARPVVFATGVEEAPFSILGSAFFVGYRGTVFILTARHVVGDTPISDVLIFPAPGAKKAIGIAEHWRVENEGGDSDTADLRIFRPSLKGIPRKIQRASRVLELDRPGLLDWFPSRYSSTFYAFGFPSPLNSVDYAKEEINMTQVLMAGNYIGHSIADEVYEVRLNNLHELESFSGLSGSPVFSVENLIGQASPSHFCGMAIRGGASEGRIHFLNSSVITLALDEAVEATRTSGQKF